jgi:hypothetical protein
MLRHIAMGRGRRRWIANRVGYPVLLLGAWLSNDGMSDERQMSWKTRGMRIAIAIGLLVAAIWLIRACEQEAGFYKYSHPLF